MAEFPTRLVLVMGGGVSLGSYAAGALTELFYALGQAAKRDGVPAAQIDVVTGASAGAMSAAVFARALTADPATIRQLHEAWVRRISIDELTKRQPQGFDPLALLSAAVIDTIATDVLTTPEHYDWRPFCNVPLRFAFTLTNIGGLTYPLSYANDPDRFFSTRLHSDHARFRIDPSAPPDVDLWDRVRRTAIASGAFPGAFPPRRITRARDDYRETTLWPGRPGEPHDMWYIDGGVLDNEPLGLARSLVDEDPQHQHNDYRYLLIDPYLNPADSPYPGPETLGAAVGGLARAILGESTAKDWIRANKVNWRVGILEDFVRDHLRPLVMAIAASAGDTGTGILGTLDDTALRISEFKVGVNQRGSPAATDVRVFLERDLGRIANDPRFEPSVRDLGPGTRRAMLQAIFILESFAGLRNKERMPLYLIAPGAARHGEHPRDVVEEHPLAGDFLYNFGGFFREEWRQHDFLCGRRDAHAVLARDLRAGDGSQLLDYPPEPGVDYDPKPIRVGPKDLSKKEREKFRDYFKDRFEPILDPHLPFLARPFKGTIAKILANRAVTQIGIEM
ncbi:MAG: DUF3376 domain-containing protein [Longimicrobiales bacterium]